MRLLGLLLVFSFLSLQAQSHFTPLPKTPKVSVTFKTWSSVFIPGLGQALNRKYWKIPVIYGGFIGLGNLYQNYQNQYLLYKTHLLAEYDTDPATVNTSGLTKEALQYDKNRARYLRDYCAAGIGLLYLLNIIDAHVDAHLFTYDVSDNLSFSPLSSSGVWGISVRLNP